MKYCEPCQREVTPVKKFSWGWFLVTSLLFFWVAGVWVYPVYYFLFKRKQCPICASKSFGTKPVQTQINS